MKDKEKLMNEAFEISEHIRYIAKLASQRGNIDCGGPEYFIIRYGNFFVLLIPCKNGHLNIGVEPDKNPFLFVEPLNTLLRKYKLN